MNRTRSTLPPVSLDTAVTVARHYLAEADGVDIHDRERVIESHATLTVCLASLLAALDAEEAQR